MLERKVSSKLIEETIENKRSMILEEYLYIENRVWKVKVQQEGTTVLVNVYTGAYTCMAYGGGIESRVELAKNCWSM